MRRSGLVACVLAAGLAFGDVITLKDGSKVTGKVEAGGSKQILVKTGDDSQAIDLDKIESIQFDPIVAEPVSKAEPPKPEPAATPAPEPEPVQKAAEVPKPAPAPEPAPKKAKAELAPRPQAPEKPPAPVATASTNGITLPPGTEIAVRTLEAIDSKTADKYKEYSGSLDDPVVLNGVTVIPADANAVLRVTDVHSAGFAKRASLSMTLIAVVIDGHRYTVETGKVDSQSGSQAKRTAEAAGGGAAAGAAIGAMTAGGAGAAVGAGVGAAAGAVAGKVFGKQVEIRPETRFTYKLEQPLVLPKPEESR